MTVKPRRPNVRQSVPPGPREQHQSPLPEQPVAPTGHASRPPPTYEELLIFQREAEDKLLEYKALVETVYEILTRPALPVPVDPLAAATSRSPLTHELAAIQRAELVRMHTAIEEAKRTMSEFDRALPKIDRRR